jgi:hypothetical protein
MKSQLVAALVQILLLCFTPDVLRKFVDMALDFVETQVLGSASSIDDALVLPICRQLRVAFSVEDNDGES